MAHSYVSLRGRDTLFRDNDLKFIMGFITKISSIGECRSAAFDDLMVWWADLASHPGPGCIDLQIEEILQDDSDFDCLQFYLSVAKKELEDMNVTLSPDFINDIILPNSAKYANHVDRDYFLELIEEFRSAIST